MKESVFQGKVKEWLEEQGCYVLKYPQSAYTHAGVSDLIWFYHDKYGFLEVKKSKDAPFRPGQKSFLEKMSKWTFAEAVYPENFEDIKKELLNMLR